MHIRNSIPKRTVDLESASDSTPPLYTIQSISGKGYGIVADVKIPAGTRILSEKPLLTTAVFDPIEEMEAHLKKMIKALPKAEQNAFLGLHNNFAGDYPLNGILETNFFYFGGNKEMIVGAIYPTICRINHSCRPNAYADWNKAIGCQTIHALRDIEKGEEITISYDDVSPSYQRRKAFKYQYGFDCDCTLCCTPRERTKSDKRRVLLGTRYDILMDNNYRVKRHPQSVLEDLKKRHQIVELEYGAKEGAPHFALVYHDAFLLCISHGDQARASHFAGREYEMRRICEGEDSLYARESKRMTLNPAKHELFESNSENWKTTKRSFPRNLHGKEFESWLWRKRE